MNNFKISTFRTSTMYFTCRLNSDMSLHSLKSSCFDKFEVELNKISSQYHFFLFCFFCFFCFFFYIHEHLSLHCRSPVIFKCLLERRLVRYKARSRCVLHLPQQYTCSTVCCIYICVITVPIIIQPVWWYPWQPCLHAYLWHSGSSKNVKTFHL